MKGKPFKETKVGQWLKNTLPDVLDKVDDHLPIVSILTAVVKGKNLSPDKQFEFDQLMLEYEQNERRDYLADVANARSLQVVALQQNDVFSKRYIYYLSSFIVAIASAFGVMLFFIEVPERNQRLVDMFCDVYLFAGALMVLNFFFGNSVRSLKNNLPVKSTI